MYLKLTDMGYRNPKWVLLLLLMMLFMPNISSIISDSSDNDECAHIHCASLAECPSDSIPKTTSSVEWVSEFDLNYHNAAEDTENDDDLFKDLEAYPLPLEMMNNIHTVAPTTGLKTNSSHEADVDAAVEAGTEIETEERNEVAAQTSTHTRRRRQIVYNDGDAGEHEAFVALRKRCCGEPANCVCKKCASIPKCPDGEVALEVSVGTGQPGSCCTTYICGAKPLCHHKNVNAVVHYWLDSCMKCTCAAENTQVCEQHCPQDEPVSDKNCYSDYLGKLMLNGETWMEDNDCSECSCENGEPKCIISLCAAVECASPKKVKGRCCPVCPGNDTEVHDTVEQATTETFDYETTTTFIKNSTGSIDSSSFRSFHDDNGSTTPEAINSTEDTITETIIELKTTDNDREDTTINETTLIVETSSTPSTAKSEPTADSDQANSPNAATEASPETTDSSTESHTSTVPTPTQSTKPIVTDAPNAESEPEPESMTTFAPSTTESVNTTTSINTSTEQSANAKELIEPTTTATTTTKTTPKLITTTTTTTTIGTTADSLISSTDSTFMPSPSTFLTTLLTIAPATSAPAPLIPESTSYRQHSPVSEKDYRMATATRDTYKPNSNIYNYLLLTAIVALVACAIAVPILIRQRRKFYCSVPNSETNLCETTTVNSDV